MVQLLFCCILVLSCQLLTFGSEEISSKLDFNEDASAKSDEVIQVAKGRIPGVRVTVDTIKLNPIESTEDDSSNSSNRTSNDSKKIVGIRTDITFEITDHNRTDGSKSTEDASVPIFKGTKGINTDRKRFRDENEDNLRHSSNSDRRKWNFHDNPFLPRASDEDDRFHSNNWGNFDPIVTYWTTRRPYHHADSSSKEEFYPYMIGEKSSQRPCNCHENYSGKTAEVWNYPSHRSLGEIYRDTPPNSGEIIIVDDKLDIYKRNNFHG